MAGFWIHLWKLLFLSLVSRSQRKINPIDLNSLECINLNTQANISTLLQLCCLVDTTSRRQITSNPCWNNVVHVNVEICNVQQRQINVVYFNVYINIVRQRQNNVDQRRNNVVNLTICKNSKEQKNIFELQINI